MHPYVPTENSKSLDWKITIIKSISITNSVIYKFTLEKENGPKRCIENDKWKWKDQWRLTESSMLYTDHTDERKGTERCSLDQWQGMQSVREWQHQVKGQSIRVSRLAVVDDSRERNIYWHVRSCGKWQDVQCRWWSEWLTTPCLLRTVLPNFVRSGLCVLLLLMQSLTQSYHLPLCPMTK